MGENGERQRLTRGVNITLRPPACYLLLPLSNARRHPTGTPSGVPVPEHDRGRGELQLCCHCETTLRADRYHWLSYLYPRGSRVLCTTLECQ